MATISNSINSFRATGLYPLDINAIPDCAYAHAETTSRPLAVEQEVDSHLETEATPQLETTEEARPHSQPEDAKMQHRLFKVQQKMKQANIVIE